jgi:hypothetical protein
MAHPSRRYPSGPGHPGWYVDPEEPSRLRHWDGEAWSTRSRPRPGWSSRAVPFETDEADLERAGTEGPAHRDELQAPVRKGARSTGRTTPWQPGQARQRGRAPAAPHGRPPAPGREPLSVPLTRSAQARRPLLVIAVLVGVAAAVVVSSFAISQPAYGPTSHYQPPSAQTSLQSFANQATKDCSAALPHYRPALQADVDGPSIAAATRKLGRLRLRLETIPTSKEISGPIRSWLQDWQDFTRYQARYARLIGPAVHRQGQLLPSLRAVDPAAQQALDGAWQSATAADQYSLLLRAPACQLEARSTPGV